MKCCAMIVISGLLLTGQSGVSALHGARPRVSGAYAGMRGQGLAEPLWANIGDFDPAGHSRWLLAAFERTAKTLGVEGDVAAIGLPGA